MLKCEVSDLILPPKTVAEPTEKLELGSLQHGRWHNLSKQSLGWPTTAQIRSIRGLAIFNDEILVGPRTDHDNCFRRYAVASAFKNGTWQTIGGTKDTQPWPNPLTDRINQIKVFGDRAYFALAGQYSEVGVAAVMSYDGQTWRKEGYDEPPFKKYSGIVSLGEHNGTLLAGAVAPGVRGPAVLFKTKDGWKENSPPGFDRCLSSFIFDIASYAGAIYIGTLDGGAHCIGGVWRYADDKWTMVAGGGQLGSWKHMPVNAGNHGVNSLLVSHGKLYASISSGSKAVIFPTYRFDGTKWEPVGAQAAPGALTTEQTFFDFVRTYGDDLLVGGSNDSVFGPPLWYYRNGSWDRFDRTGIEPLLEKPRDLRFFYDVVPLKDFLVGVLGGNSPGGGEVWIYSPP